MIKPTDRLIAGFLAAILLVSPVREMVRLVAGMLAENASVANTWLSFPWYFGGLLVSYVVILAIIASLRLVVATIEGEELALLRSLDMGVRGTWPWRFSLLLVVVAAATVIAGDVEGQSAATAEVLVAGAALLIAVAGRQAPRRFIEGYDPMPFAGDGITAMEGDGTADRIPASSTWEFRPVPGEVGAPGERHTVRVNASAARAENYSRMRAELVDDRDYAQRVRDGTCPEMQDMARQLRAISIASGYDHIAELNNVLAMAAAVCDAGEDEDGECRSDVLKQSPLYPLESILSGHGDGRDCAVLAAACLALLGYEVGFVETEGPDGDSMLALAVAAPGTLNGADLSKDSLGREWIYFRFDADLVRFTSSEQAAMNPGVGTFIPVMGVIDALRPISPSDSPPLVRSST
jgi:hypothetical protein